MKTKLILRAWEVITCKNGHPCYLTTKQVPIHAAMFYMDVTIPLNGCLNAQLLDFCICTQCGGKTMWSKLGSLQCWVKDEVGNIRRRNDLNYVEVEQDD